MLDFLAFLVLCLHGYTQILQLACMELSMKELLQVIRTPQSFDGAEPGWIAKEKRGY